VAPKIGHTLGTPGPELWWSRPKYATGRLQHERPRVAVGKYN